MDVQETLYIGSTDAIRENITAGIRKDVSIFSTLCLFYGNSLFFRKSMLGTPN